MANETSKLLLIGLLTCFCLSLCLPTLALAQDAGPPSIDFDLPAGSEDFGEADFKVEDTVTQEEATRFATWFAIGSSLCTGIPAMIVGLVVGYFVGKSRAPRSATSAQE